MEKIVEPNAENILSKSFIFIMAMTCGICAGSSYYNQPLIYWKAEAIKVKVDEVALTIVISYVSYAVGLL
ncbi:MFS transporter, partial [Acinetobacter baumannii]